MRKLLEVKNTQNTQDYVTQGCVFFVTALYLQWFSTH